MAPRKRIRPQFQSNLNRPNYRSNVDPASLFGSPKQANFDSTMDKTRRDNDVIRREAGMADAGMSNISMSTGRPRDPMFYWKQNHLPFDFTKQSELRKLREFCSDPGELVWMGDYSFKPIGEIVPGDEVISWTKPLPNQKSRLVRSTVLATNRRVAPETVKITTESGRTWIGTPDHKFANPYYSPGQVSGNRGWRQPEHVHPEVGKLLRHIIDPTEPLTSDKRMLTRVSSTQDRIVSVESLGPGQVVSMETTEGTYIVSGFASYNCRLLYMTHPVVAACVDIYSKLPLQGMHFECKDEELVEFYTDLFMDQLKYEDHLVMIGRQYWLAGEVFSIGAWNETLGVWEDEQLVNPDDVEVEASLFVGKPRFMMRLPETLRNILNERAPVHLYQQIAQEYPELLHYTGEDDFMPVSNYIMHHMKFEADDYSNRGISILMRAWRTIIQEEMLMTALDAIADRLYTPFIVARLGASATDLGTQSPWIPTQEQKEEFAGAMDAALAGDFRVLITHFATEVESLFGRENVPDLSVDFDRITERILMAFGLSQTMLTGASAGETYAADALNRDVVTQLLTHYQRKLQQFFKERAEIVAEAQGHFDYEIRNGERYLLTEDIFEIDEETGEEVISEVPKLLYPELKFKILNLTDEQAQQEFVEELASTGVPIPIRERIKSLGITLEEMIEMKQQETIDLAVAEQETRRELYLKLRAQGLPVPEDLLKDFSPKAQVAGMEAPPLGASDVAVGQLGIGGPQDLPVLAPTQDDMVENQSAAEDQMMDDSVNEMTDPGGIQDTDASDDETPSDNPDVPEESNDQRKRMPKKSANMKRIAKEAGRLQVRNATRKYYKDPDNSIETDPKDFQPTGKFGPPKHVGMRRHLSIPPDLIYRDPDDE